jgi:hypothetical protein
VPIISRFVGLMNPILNYFLYHMSTVFYSAGMICVYLSNDQMSAALNNFDDTVNSNIDDLTTYISNTVKVS